VALTGLMAEPFPHLGMPSFLRLLLSTLWTVLAKHMTKTAQRVVVPLLAIKPFEMRR